MTTAQSTQHRSVSNCEWSISQLPGIAPQNYKRLRKLGIETTAQLLRSGKTQAQQMMLANLMHLNVRDVSKWVAMSDLARIPGVSYQYCGLLLHAGVGSVAQLAKIPAHRLHQQILRLQVATLHRRDLCPPVDQVHKWVQQAQRLA
jgi:predicted RecB family nuclease